MDKLEVRLWEGGGWLNSTQSASVPGYSVFPLEAALPVGAAKLHSGK